MADVPLSSAGVRFGTFEIIEAADTWTIDHNFGTKPAVDVHTFVNEVRMRAFPKAIEFPTDNQVIIRWTSPRTGTVSLATKQ